MLNAAWTEGMQVRIGGCKRLKGMATAGKPGLQDFPVPEWTPARCIVFMAPDAEQVMSICGQSVPSLVSHFSCLRRCMTVSRLHLHKDALMMLKAWDQPVNR